MKKLILALQNDYLVFIFVLLGLVLIIFPAQVVYVLPYLMGAVLLLYAVVNTIVSLKYPDSKAKLGGSIIGVVLGITLLMQKHDAIGTMGVIWAVMSLFEAAQEIDEIYKTKKVNVISMIGIVVSAVLALLLILDPFKHFEMHIRILGLEILFSAFIRRRSLIRQKKESQKA